MGFLRIFVPTLCAVASCPAFCTWKTEIEMQQLRTQEKPAQALPIIEQPRASSEQNLANQLLKLKALDRGDLAQTVASYVQRLTDNRQSKKWSMWEGLAKVGLTTFVEALLSLLYDYKIDRSILIQAVAYIAKIATAQPDELNKPSPDFCLSTTNVFRLLLASVLISIKFHSDEPPSNSVYAISCGLERSDVNEMELSFLLLLKDSVMSSVEEIGTVATNLLDIHDVFVEQRLQAQEDTTQMIAIANLY